MFDFKMPPLEWRSAAIPKKSGGVRKIKIPNDELKDVQRQILQYLYGQVRDGRIQVSSAAHGFIPFRNTSSGLSRHDLKSRAFLCCDVKDFFDSFPTEPVREKLLAAGMGPYLVNKILKACTFDGHFPQGSPASPYLTNIGMIDCDKKLCAYADTNGLFYTRYADDITFSVVPDGKADKYLQQREDEDTDKYRRRCKAFSIRIFKAVDLMLGDLGLHLKHKKDHVIWRNAKIKPAILGITLRQDNLGYSADKKLRRNTRAAVHNLANKIRGNLGAVFPEDFIKWRHIYGNVTYMDYVRSFSKEGVNGADPIVGEEDWNYLESLFMKGGIDGCKRRDCQGDCCNAAEGA